jgi:DNA (cytosine-5)-methyltransferase 1
MSSGSTFRYADTFAGIGGFAAVLEDLGGESAYVVEIDKHAAAVYEANWGHRAYGDITRDATDAGFRPLEKLDSQQLGESQAPPQIDVFTGGFPCQPFSKSGAQRGMDETRGTLFWNIETILRETRPTIVVLENVRNLAGPRHIHEWQVIIKHLRDLGYQVSSTPAIFSPHQIAPEFGGAPQVRERVYITATLVPDGMVADPEPAPVRLPDHVLMKREWDLRSDLPLEEGRVPGTSISADEQRWIDHWDEMVQTLRELAARDADRTGEPARSLPGHPIWASTWVTSQAEKDALMYPGGAKVPSWKADFLQKNWSLYNNLLERGDRGWLNRWLRKTCGTA